MPPAINDDATEWRKSFSRVARWLHSILIMRTRTSGDFVRSGETLNPPSISRVSAHEQDRALETLVSAFTDDPVERWLYPKPRQYLTWFPQFLAAFGGAAFDEGTVWRL
jgi:hypothetical protein